MATPTEVSSWNLASLAMNWAIPRIPKIRAGKKKKSQDREKVPGSDFKGEPVSTFLKHDSYSQTLGNGFYNEKKNALIPQTSMLLFQSFGF